MSGLPIQAISARLLCASMTAAPFMARALLICPMWLLKTGFADNGTAEVLVEAIDPLGQPGQSLVPLGQTANCAKDNSRPDIPPLNQGRYLQVGAFDQCSRRSCCRKKIRGYTSHPILVQQRDHAVQSLDWSHQRPDGVAVNQAGT